MTGSTNVQLATVKRSVLKPAAVGLLVDEDAEDETM
jgi:hypothetical protein